MNEGKIYIMIMKRMCFVLCFELLIMTMVGCSFISVDTEYDPAINFADYRTFKWMPLTDRTGRDPIVDSSLFTKRLQYAVNQTLTAKGYREEPSGAADFLITYHISLTDKVEVTNYGYGYGAWRGRSARYNNYWGPTNSREMDMYQYTLARLILDFIDSKSNELIWRGLASGATNPTGGNEKELNEAVDKMLEKFPPQ